jgi:hypothetical protein
MKLSHTSALLFSLVLLDLCLSTGGFFFPEFWFRLFHGVHYIDPEGLLRRSAASWAAFALL